MRVHFSEEQLMDKGKLNGVCSRRWIVTEGKSQAQRMCRANKKTDAIVCTHRFILTFECFWIQLVQLELGAHLLLLLF